MTSFGRLDLQKDHPLGSSKSKFAISEHMRAKICSVDQAVVYEEANKLIQELVGVKIGSSQLKRVCTSEAGDKVEHIIDKAAYFGSLGHTLQNLNASVVNIL